MKKVGRISLFLGVWFLTTAVFYILAVVCFPVDDTNTLMAPDWYILLMGIAPIGCGVLTLKLRKLAAQREARVQAIMDTPGDTFQKAVQLVREHGSADVSMLQRRLRLGYAQTVRLIEDLENRGVLRADGTCAPVSAPPTGPMPSSYVECGGIETELLKVDLMEGHAFEYYCADLLRKTGFTEVEVTQGSGDQGVDILAARDGIKYAIQCKCYSSDLGNKPVQEVATGKVIYHCHIGAVLTNRHFTPGAQQAAEATGVLLWDREKLIELIEAAKIT